MQPIVRGRFSHTLQDDLSLLLKSSFSNLENSRQIKELEMVLANKIGRSNCVVFPFARTALYFVLKSMGFKPGDKILMPAITIKSILDVVLSLGLVPIFVDSDINTACFELESLEENISKFAPRVCLVTYLFGVMPDIERIITLLRANKIFIIEDFSQAFNASSNGKKAGSFGDVSIYSASAIKTFDTYGGGFAFTDNLKLNIDLRHFQSTLKKPSRIALMKKISNYFVKNLITNKYIFASGVFQILRFFTSKGSEKFDRFVGRRSVEPINELPMEWFYSYTSVQAKKGLQLLGNVEANDVSRVSFAKDVISTVTNLHFISGQVGANSIFWQLIAIPRDPQKLRKFLYSRGIDSAYTSLIEISKLPQYGIDAPTPNADRIHKNAVYIPCYAHLNSDERSHIIDALKKYE
jgi:dTDP-4-amino-4,6-dideoxygalactose transaminase